MRNSGPTNGAGSARGVSTHPFLSRADDSVGLLARITTRQGARGVALAEKTGRGWTRRATGRGRRAFTRVELCACLVAGALLFTLALPALANGRSRSHLAQCFNNLRQIGAGFQSWAMGHEEMFPWQVRAANGGTSNLDGGSPVAANTFIHFAFASNEMVTPRIFVCPSDLGKKVASNFRNSSTAGFLNPNFQNNAVSYVVGLHGSVPRPDEILSGDRNFRVSASVNCPVVNVPASRLYALDTTVGWTNGVHDLTGNFLFSNGAVQTTDRAGFQSRIALPDGSGFGASFDFLIPSNPQVIP